MNRVVNLVEKGQVLASFSVLEGTFSPDAIDARQLLGETGMVFYDPGFFSTASCKSSITYIDGDNGVLRYRGYNILELVNTHDFPSIANMLINGHDAAHDDSKKFSKKLDEHCSLDDSVKKVIVSFPRCSHPMSVLIAAFAALEHLHNGDDYEMAIKAIAVVPSIIAAIHRHLLEKPIIDADPSLNYSERFVKMIFGKNDTTIAKALDAIFILHADHEQNASTSSVRASASSGANIFACIASGVATLSGPAHGGANEAVIKMINDIGQASKIPAFIKKAKDKSDPFRLMGFGHRVYKNYDPRAKVLKEISKEILDGVKNSEKQNEKLEIAKQLEKIALEDEYFITRNLYPNVDFYSGIILEAIEIPTNIFTPIFALARTSGWVAQYLEAKKDTEQKIYRPRQLYLGR